MLPHTIAQTVEIQLAGSRITAYTRPMNHGQVITQPDGEEATELAQLRHAGLQYNRRGNGEGISRWCHIIRQIHQVHAFLSH